MFNQWQGPFPIDGGWGVGQTDDGFRLTKVADGVRTEWVDVPEVWVVSDDAFEQAVWHLCADFMRRVQASVRDYGKPARPDVSWVPQTLRVIADSMERGQ